MRRAARRAGVDRQGAPRRWRRWWARRPARSMFTSGGTEANNLALSGAGRRRVLVSAVEHDSVLSRRAACGDRSRSTATASSISAALERLLAAYGRAEPWSSRDAGQQRDGRAAADRRGRAPRARGRRAGALRCGAGRGQGPGRPARRWASTISACPPTSSAARPGVGALVVRAGAPFGAGPLKGGGQESKRRAGTENVAGIVGLRRGRRGGARRGSDAAALARPASKLRLSRSRRARVFSARRAGALPNTSCISMPGVTAETQVMALDLAGVCVSAGAACSSGKVQRSAGPAGHGRGSCRGRHRASESAPAGDTEPGEIYRSLDRGLGATYISEYDSRILLRACSSVGVSRG